MWLTAAFPFKLPGIRNREVNLSIENGEDRGQPASVDG